MFLELSALTSDNTFQPRTELNTDHADSMFRTLEKDPGAFESKPIHVWRIEGTLTIVDGFHRYEAFKNANCETIPAEIHETTRLDAETDEELLLRTRSEALQFAVKANQHHGSPLRRTRSDNQRAVRLLLENPLTRRRTDAWIAEIVGVSGPTVARIRKEKPEYQTDERIGGDFRSVSRDLLASNAGNKLRKQASGVESTSDSDLTDARVTLVNKALDEEPGFTEAQGIDDEVLSDEDTELVGQFRENFDADAGQADHLRHLQEQFTEVRLLWNCYRAEILEQDGIDFNSCNLLEFGRAILNQTSNLKQENERLRQKLETAQVGPTVDAPEATTAKDPKPQATPSAKPQTKADSAASQAVPTDWRHELKAKSPSFEPLIGRVQEWIDEGKDWRSFSNDRAWKNTKNSVEKPLRDEAAELIKRLLQ
jgi:ParB-like nuclease domain